jgi:hypothetical protein
VPEATMAKRISRAKQQLRSAGVRFGLPPTAEWAGRLQVERGRYCPWYAADAGGTVHFGGGVGADHLRQRGDGLHRGPGGHRPVQRPADGGRSAAGGPARGEPTAAGPLGQPSPVRPPVPSRGLSDHAPGEESTGPPMAGPMPTMRASGAVSEAALGLIGSTSNRT